MKFIPDRKQYKGLSSPCCSSRPTAVNTIAWISTFFQVRDTFPIPTSESQWSHSGAFWPYHEVVQNPGAAPVNRAPPFSQTWYLQLGRELERGAFQTVNAVRDWSHVCYIERIVGRLPEAWCGFLTLLLICGPPAPLSHALRFLLLSKLLTPWKTATKRLMPLFALALPLDLESAYLIS